MVEFLDRARSLVYCRLEGLPSGLISYWKFLSKYRFFSNFFTFRGSTWIVCLFFEKFYKILFLPFESVEFRADEALLDEFLGVFDLR